MARTAYHVLTITAIVVQLACRNALYPQQVVNLSDSTQSLSTRWQHALRHASAQSMTGGFWIGYSFKKVMPENSFVGSYSSDPDKNKPSLREMITGIRVEDHWAHEMHNFEGEMEGEFSFENGERHVSQIVKEIGVLMHIRNPQNQDINEVNVSNLSLHVSLHGDPLIWIGNVPGDESVDLLRGEYEKSSSSEIRKKIITAVGIHSPTERVFQFLRSILLGSDPGILRKEAAFWIGQCNLDEAVALLEHLAEDDTAGGVREQSIVGLGAMKNAEAGESLIRLARDAPKEDVRKTAAFWLGQKASAKIAATDRESGGKDNDLEIKKKAVFALYELPAAGGVESLIQVAEKNQEVPLRKEAIFWLSQIESPRALEALIQIIRN